MTPPKTWIYTEIVDEFAHAMSEAFDLPLDLEQLEEDLLEVDWDGEPGGMVVRPRLPTENECKAYGIEDPETAAVYVSINANSPGKIVRTIVNNSTGHCNSMLGLPPRNFLKYYQDWKTEKSFGLEVAYYVGVCQGRDGYEFNDNCSDVMNDLRSPGAVPKNVRRIVHASLLKPELDLNEIAEEIDRVMTRSTRFVAKTLVDHSVLEETLTDLIETVDKCGLSVDGETAARWIEFCGKRSVSFDCPGSPEVFTHLYDPVFGEIDKAVRDHKFFSAFVCGPKDWPVEVDG